MEALSYLKEQITRRRRGKPPEYLSYLRCAKRKPVEKLDEVVNACYHTSIAALRRTDSLGLTNLIGKFGTIAEEILELEYQSKNDRFSVGAVIFESLASGQDLLVPLKGSVAPDATYMAYPTPLMRLIASRLKPIYTSLEPIPAINAGNINIIKGWSKKNEKQAKKFAQLVEDNEAFIQSANVLQGTAWQVNAKVLQAIKKYEYQIAPTDLQDPRTLSGMARKAAQAKISKSAANIATIHQARTLVGEIFYQYVDFDWRGRVYYKESFLNFQGNDLARSLLKFAQAKPLGESGLFWLAVHTANSFNQSYSINELPDWLETDYVPYLEAQGLTDISVDKMTLEDRARWTQENMDHILMTGYMEGLPDCEKPYSYLACCLEYVSMQDYANPENYPCSLPISVDGSNNGWQHLGAMLKDELTGSLVGMVPSEVPNDLYVTVAKDLVANCPEFFDGRGMKMKQIRKAIAKRGTMTKAYSAGAKTMAENMWNDVYQLGYHEKFNISEEDCFELAQQLVESIKRVCPKPMEAMKFLQTIGGQIAVSKGDRISWDSPSGFPVTQTYMRSDSHQVTLRFSPPEDVFAFSGRIRLRVLEATEFPDKAKHAAAISPNFVHSMDAAHLALTIANWNSHFAAVHDSFSVHACDIEDLLVLIKSVFIDMYDSENFLMEVSSGMAEAPETGDLNINEIMNCDFFFA